ncbi:MAG: Hsp20/alpha crystallin family protein [Opitutaceae bacterium]|nr:Hsp20/alpha crystallin family protein [Opitutaceae bacterium]
MTSTLHPVLPPSRKAGGRTPPEKFREPSYDCQEQRDAMKLVVYVPGVAASGVDIEAHGADLTVTARKPHVVRVNWQALHLETAQRDYRLRLRLGTGFNYAAMEAEISQGVLTVRLPKLATINHSRLRAVA